MAKVLRIAAVKDVMRRRLWKMLLACGHVQYELFTEHPKPLKSVPECRCCAAIERGNRFRATGVTTYQKKPVPQVQGMLF